MSYVEIITLPSTSQRIAHQTKPVHRPAHLQPASLRPLSSSNSQRDRYIVSSSPAPALLSASSSLSSTSSTSPSFIGSSMSYHRNLSQPWRLAPALPVISPPSANPFSPSGQRPSTRASVSEIIPRLLISDLSFAENPAMLASHRITHIMSTMPDNIFRPPPTLLPLQPARMQIKVEDLPFAELAAHLPATTAWIRDALASSPDARVLVHCAEGVSRSVSVVAAYLMAQYGWTPIEALGYVKSKRRIADPNFGFVQQLHEYARDVLGRQVVIPTQPFIIP